VSSVPQHDHDHGFPVCVEVVDNHHRVIATAAIPAGGRILRFDGVLVDRPTRRSLQVGDDEHLVLPPTVSIEQAVKTHPWVFLNHACEPNAVRRGRDLLALRAIAAGDAITFDYCTTEAELSTPFRCRCGGAACRGDWVRGFLHLSRAEQERRRPHLSAHLAARLDRPPAGGRL
jgi:hypothetical protein